MPLPDDFSPWEHLQSVLMQSHNRLVREEFRDLGDDWEEDITLPRSSLRVACTIRDDDSAIQTLLRMLFFYGTLRKAQDFHPALYTTPIDRYQQEIKFAPQITLYFREDLEDVEEGYAAIDAEISFRVQNQNYNTFTEANAITFANKIKTEFCPNNGYRWRKGRTKISYRDKEKGYLLSINAYSEAEAREVISKVLSIQNDGIDNSKMIISQLAETPPTIPPTEFIYGNSRRIPRRKPVGYVRFQFAELHLWGVKNAITLVDRSYRRRNPLVPAY
jgi:hypothetical protein